MKTIITAALLLSGSAAFAAGTSTSQTYCQPVQLETAAGAVSAYVAQNGHFDAAAAFAVTTDKDSDDHVAVVGLKVSVLKSALFDETTRTNCGWGCFRTDSKTYTVKLTVKADETIGFEIMGDVGMAVKTIEAYTICNETTSARVEL